MSRILLLLIVCPSCGSSERRLLHADLTDRTYMFAPGRWNLFRFARCSCAYLDPRPTEQTLNLAYGDYYEGTAAPAGEPNRWRL
jgi:hypothetical protein